ncbi:hypothetical protein I0Q12_01960 [Rhodococcus sp. CX]|uniref:hypothetical protein n=1 Tax=Rhodococcus sp. CX TaxID=2789880 RepID=UPI0018CD45D2|nr:hypothetical protein [Rhodococcus sp. CX]MBH0118364.1 hypothetical protein [Rhodococcus sp. CX]
MAYRDSLAMHGAAVDIWIETERGYPDLPRILGEAREGTEIYACGPGSMIDAVSAEFLRHPELGNLHVERFAASGPTDASGDAFEVELRHSLGCN